MRSILGCLVLVAAGICPSLAEDTGPKKLVVCSTTQIADFTRQIVGDRWKVECVLAPGEDPHLYRTTADDSILVAHADLCLANGWHLEGGQWMESLANDEGKLLVRCIEGVKPLVLDEDDGSGELKDPHGWFTPINAAVYVRNILRGVSEVDPANAEEYRSRAELLQRQLQTLHAWILKQVNQIPASRRILVTSHDAFGYFCREYGFRAAAPEGWSTGVEVGGDVTAARRQATIDSIRKFGVRSIFVETSVNPKLILEIAQETGVQDGGALYSDSMGPAGTAGESYIGMMRENVLRIVHGLK